MHRRSDPVTGRDRGPFHFSSRTADGGGRFDLLAPRGTCYLSDARIGAWVETFGGAALVDARDVRDRALTATRCPRSASLLDLTAVRAGAAGITLDLHAGADRESTWSLAQAADAQRGVRGLATWARHDPSATTRTVALLDDAGEHSPFGWPWRVVTADPLDDPALLAALADRGLGVAEVPHELPTVPPPVGSAAS